MTTKSSDTPLVSVVTPSFNQGPYIRETIESVRNQSYKNFEHIVMDGGSTDETVEILKSYPHLKWTSERDNGQADALNKALKLASGEVIAWLNSDDLYEPNALELAVQALKRAPVAMGRCLIFEDGKGPLYVVPNFGRNWFDLLKYWIAYSIPTQPAIFFKRSVLEEVIRDNGEFVDPTLHYCMDYDLWTRVCVKYPFTNLIDAVTSRYRFTETNKTALSKPMHTYAGAEMAAIFNRAEGMTGHTKQLSIVIDAAQLDDTVLATINSIFESSATNLEIVIATGKVSKDLRHGVEALNAKQGEKRDGRFIYPIVCPGSSAVQRVSNAISRSSGRIIFVLPAGARVSPDFGFQLERVFSDDRTAVVIPYDKEPALVAALQGAGPEEPEQADFSLDALLFGELPIFTFAVRRAAWLEGPELHAEASLPQALKRLVFGKVRQGWHARVASSGVGVDLSRCERTPLVGIEKEIGAAELIVETAALKETDPFWNVRSSYRLCQPFSDETVTKAKELLAMRGGK